MRWKGCEFAVSRLRTSAAAAHLISRASATASPQGEAFRGPIGIIPVLLYTASGILSTSGAEACQEGIGDPGEIRHIADFFRGTGQKCVVIAQADFDRSRQFPNFSDRNPLGSVDITSNYPETGPLWKPQHPEDMQPRMQPPPPGSPDGAPGQKPGVSTVLHTLHRLLNKWPRLCRCAGACIRR